MNEFESISLSRLHNSEHLQFMTDLDVLIKKLVAEELGIQEFYPLFKETLAAEDVAVGIEQGSAKSKVLEVKDKLRDKTWNAINTRVDSAILSPVEDEVTSGYAIKRIINQYGDIRNEPYNEETADMTKLIGDLQKAENAVHLEKTSIKTWVPMLKTQNDDFQVVFNQRNTEFSDRESGDVKAERKKVDPVYHKILKRVDAMVETSLAKPVAKTFIKELNERIQYFNNVIAARDGRNKNDKTPPKAQA